MFNSLRSRLLGSYVLIILICLAVAALVMVLLLAPQVLRLSYLRLADRSIPTALHVRSLRARGLSAEQITNTLAEQAATQGTRILIATRQGEVLADTEGRWVGRKVDLRLDGDGLERNRGYFQGRLLVGEGLFLYVAVSSGPLSQGGSEQRVPVWYVVLLSPPRQAIASILGEMTAGFVLTGVFALLVSFAVAFLIARSVAKPLRRIEAATEAMALGSYDEQLTITSPDEVRRLAERFNVMAQEVKASRQAQRDFVANVSHELRTPLTSIQGFSQAILDGAAGGEESRHRAAQVINEEAARMARLVDDLLDLARIEAGQVIMAREPVSVGDVLQGCLDKLSLRAEQCGVSLEIQLEGNPTVSGDRDRLAQVFTNLLDNALSHTPPQGRVVVTATSAVEGATKRGLQPRTVAQITVSDTGAGIAPEELPRIFERFYRGDKSRTREGRGAGLGLAIAREIVQAHEGRIEAESVVGLGTRFTVTLPQVGDGG